jgi:hypothetical protein
MCLQNFGSQVVERHNKPEIEARYGVFANLAPHFVKERCTFERCTFLSKIIDVTYIIHNLRPCWKSAILLTLFQAKQGIITQPSHCKQK